RCCHHRIRISLVPNLDMIVRGSLTKGILGAVVRQIYIVNTENYDVLKEHCVHTLQSGNCLLIFPEGSRTPRNHHIPYKKGAARIALASGCSIIPLRIWGNDKYGIGKGDPLFSYNHREKYWYDITMLPAIDPKDFTDLAEPTAAKRIMDKVKSEIGNTVITETEDR
ncbi:MAG: 1-acyl-sn-glycerol-3-phosphate acyltransferase, partial [Treponema sp.]|nr:1-acyl-sn-glycerol-3-phosphate acyltransferase [Treponema sp.]